MVASRRGAFTATLVAGLLTTAAALADKPLPGQMNFQPPATPTMARLVDFHDQLLVIITLITLFVLGLLVYVMIRFNEKRHPTPSKTTHNTVIEVAWTVVPVLILVYIAAQSFPFLYFADRSGEPEMTLKATGHQWYWSYEYPDHGSVAFDANLDWAATGEQRLLQTDNHVIVPVNTQIRLLTTASDVIHAWAMPSFGVKLDSVPGKINETWFEVTREGVFYGQCSELCGNGHGYMPIVVEAVSKAKFDAWIKERQAAMNGGPASIARADSSNWRFAEGSFR
jgi:cytochrome c oxidase subunit 2